MRLEHLQWHFFVHTYLGTYYFEGRIAVLFVSVRTLACKLTGQRYENAWTLLRRAFVAMLGKDQRRCQQSEMKTSQAHGQGNLRAPRCLQGRSRNVEQEAVL